MFLSYLRLVNAWKQQQYEVDYEDCLCGAERITDHVAHAQWWIRTKDLTVGNFEKVNEELTSSASIRSRSRCGRMGGERWGAERVLD